MPVSPSQLLDYIRSPYHLGQPNRYDFSGSRSSRRCGDTVTLYLKTADHHITELWHTARGCVVSQAAASWLCQWAEGQSLYNLLNIPDESFVNPLGPLTPMRRQCALLSLRCLKQLVQQELSAEGHIAR